MGSYTTVTGGSPIQPSQISARVFSITGNVQLYWPTSFVNTENVVAGFMAITATDTASNLIMPDVTEVSVGTVVLIANTGSNAFNIYNSNNTLITNITAGQLYYLCLIDNTPPLPSNTWYVDLIGGSGTSGATAAALQGIGLSVLPYATTKLNTNFPVSSQNSNYQIVYTDLASALIMTGGTNTVTLPLSSAVNVGNGFYLAINNQGSGIITIIPTSPDTLDGGSSFVLDPQTNAWFVSDGAGHWYSFGFSEIQLASVTWPNGSVSIPSIRSTADQQTGMYWPSTGNLGFSCSGEEILSLSTTTVTSAVPVLAGSGSNTLPGFAFAQASNTGFFFTPTQINVCIDGDNLLHFSYTAVNSSTPIVSTGTTITNAAYQFNGIAANSGIWATSSGIFVGFNNTTSMQLTSTAINIVGGSSTLPGLGFLNSPGTGLFLGGSNPNYTIGVTLTGTNLINISSTDFNTLTSVTAGPTSGGASASLPTYGFNAISGTGMYWSTTHLSFSINGNNILSLNNAASTIASLLQVNTGSTSAAAYGFNGYINTGMYLNTSSTPYLSFITGPSGDLVTINEVAMTVVPDMPLVLNGDLKINNNGIIKIKVSGASSAGRATLVQGTITISNTSVTANTQIHVSYETVIGSTGVFQTTKTPGNEFTINSLTAGTTSINTSDQSVVNWFMVETY